MPGETISEFLGRVIRKRTRRLASGILESGRRVDTLTVGKRGRYVRYRQREGEIEDIAIIPTLQKAAIRSRIVGEKVLVIDRKDLCEKIRRRKRPAFIAIVFDTSTSMIQQGQAYTARKLMDLILLDAYQHRDRIAIVGFSGHEASIRLPITPSVDRARDVISALEFGGASPLFHGLMKGIEILEEKGKGERESMLVLILITDGGVNVPLNPVMSIEESLDEISSQLKDKDILLIVIDMSFGRCEMPYRIAEKCGGEYYMPEPFESEYKFVDPEEIRRLREVIAIPLISREVDGVLIRNMGPDAIQKIAKELDAMALEREFISSCVYHCEPGEIRMMCRECRLKTMKGEIETTVARIPFIRIPGSLTPAQLLGRVFVRNVVHDSILAQVNGGILFLEDVSLIDRAASRILYEVKQTGVARVYSPLIKKEVSYPSKFILVGYLPEGKSINPVLLQVFKICMDGSVITGPSHTLRRIMEQRSFEQNPDGFVKNLERGAREMLFTIIRSRTLYQKVETPASLYDLIVRICSEFSTSGNLAEVLIADVARAIASLHSAMKTSEADILLASEYVLPLIKAKEDGSGIIMSNADLEKTLRGLLSHA